MKLEGRKWNLILEQKEIGNLEGEIFNLNIAPHHKDMEEKYPMLAKLRVECNKRMTFDD